VNIAGQYMIRIIQDRYGLYVIGKLLLLTLAVILNFNELLLFPYRRTFSAA